MGRDTWEERIGRRELGGETFGGEDLEDIIGRRSMKGENWEERIEWK